MKYSDMLMFIGTFRKYICYMQCMWDAGRNQHYSDIIMGVMASEITSLTIIYWTVYSGTEQRKHQSLASLTGEFPTQMGSNAENVSIWWCHHELTRYILVIPRGIIQLGSILFHSNNGLMTQIHYLNLCWLTISKVQWHSSEHNFAIDAPAISH